MWNEKSKALIAGLAAALGIPGLPPDATGGIRLTVGEATDVYLYAGDDDALLIVAPVGPMPRTPEYGLAVYLLRANMFDSDLAPFHIGIDQAGTLVMWGRAPVADFDGPKLAALVDAVAERVEDIRVEVMGEEEPAG
ncbi:MAG TPA: CesT family type III secretion system chaperone [Stellaceae bacterium]|nr:CesT family type III secretion system chaperone [Stellaceae bacterium]